MEIPIDSAKTKREALKLKEKYDKRVGKKIHRVRYLKRSKTYKIFFSTRRRGRIVKRR